MADLNAFLESKKKRSRLDALLERKKSVPPEASTEEVQRLTGQYSSVGGVGGTPPIAGSTAPAEEFFLGGPKKVVKGVRGLGGEDRAGAAADILEGTAQTALTYGAPTIARGLGAAFKAAPLATAAKTGAELAGGYALQQGVERGMENAGYTPGQSRLGGFVAGMVPLVGTASRVRRGLSTLLKTPEPPPSVVPKGLLPPAPETPIPLQTGAAGPRAAGVTGISAAKVGKQALTPEMAEVEARRLIQQRATVPKGTPERQVLDQKIQDLLKYRQPTQMEMPITEPNELTRKGGQRTLQTGGYKDVPPEGPVYGTMAEPAGTPPEIGGGGVLLASKEAAASSYPALKRRAQDILRTRTQEATLQRELTTLEQSAPTPSNINRLEKIQQDLNKIAAKRQERGVGQEEEKAILEAVEQIERDIPRAELGAAQQATKTAKQRGLTKEQAAESIQESTLGPEFAPPLVRRSVAPPSGAPPTTPGMPEKFSQGERDRVRMPSILQRSMARPQTVLRKIGGAAAEVADPIERGLAEGKLLGSQRFYRMNKAGLLKLTPEEDVNVMDVLQKGARPVSPKAARVAEAAKGVLDDIAREAQSATPTGEPMMVKNLDGSFQVFTPLENYAPHHIPPVNVLGNVNSPIRKDIVKDMVRRGEVGSPEEASQMVDDFVAYIQKKTERPSSVVAYLRRKNPNMGDRQIINLLERFRTKPKRYGALEQHRTLDLPFYDPSAKRALDNYVKNASSRIALSKRLGQGGEVIDQALKRVSESIVEKGPSNPEDVWRLAKGEVDKLLGQKPTDQDAENMSALLRTFGAFKIGPVTSIANSFQATLFGLLRADFPTTMKGLGRSFTKAGRESAYRAGADLEQAIRLARLESGAEAGFDPSTLKGRIGNWLQEKSGEALTRYMHWNTFARSELWQRVIGHNIGEVWGEKMTRRLIENPNDRQARYALEDMMLDPDELVARLKQTGKATLTDQEAQMAGMRMSDILNFSNRPEDRASGFHSALGKLFWQFKTFMYGAARLSYDGIVGEWQRGNKARALRNIGHMIVTFPLAGETVQALRTLIKEGPEGLEDRYGKDWRANPIGMAIENMAEVGAWGMFMNTLQSARYGKVLEGVAGPIPSAGAEGLAGAVQPMWPTGDKEPSPEKALFNIFKWSVKHMPLSATLLYPFMKDELREMGREIDQPAGRSKRRGRQGRGTGRSER